MQLKMTCKCLRSKEMYYQGRGQEDNAFSGGAFWCTRTQEVFGPDGEPAETLECQHGRACFQK